MSQETVRSIKLTRDEEGYYYAVIVSGSDVCSPRQYKEWDYCKGLNYTKEKLEKSILLDFFQSRFLGSRSRYGKAINKIMTKDIYLLDRYWKINKLHNKVWTKYLSSSYSKTRTRQLLYLSLELKSMREEEAEEVLYKYLYKDKKEGKEQKKG